MKHGTAIGWIVGIFVFILLAQLIPESVCNDGWRSPSIGNAGACSHHRGVNRHGFLRMLALVVSIFIGVIVTSWVKEGNPLRRIRERKGEEEQKHLASQTPYGSLEQYEKHLREIGVSEDQIQSELRKYKKT